MATVPQTEPLRLHGRTFAAPGPIIVGFVARFFHAHLGRLPGRYWEGVLILESAAAVPHEEAQALVQSVMPAAWRMAQHRENLDQSYARARCRFVKHVNPCFPLAAERYPVLLPGGILSRKSMGALLRMTAKVEAKPEQEILATDPLVAELVDLSDEMREVLVNREEDCE